MTEFVIVHNDKEYDLRYDIKKLRTIESVLRKPIFLMLRNNCFSIDELITLVGYGLVEKDTGKKVLPQKGIEIAENLIGQKGAYTSLSEKVAKSLTDDCGFLFPDD